MRFSIIGIVERVIGIKFLEILNSDYPNLIINLLYRMICKNKNNNLSNVKNLLYEKLDIIKHYSAKELVDESINIKMDIYDYISCKSQFHFDIEDKAINLLSKKDNIRSEINLLTNEILNLKNKSLSLNKKKLIEKNIINFPKLGVIPKLNINGSIENLKKHHIYLVQLLRLNEIALNLMI